MEIISHRYLFEGKNQEAENILSQLQLADKKFSFFETDIRRLKTGEFYISHDPKERVTSDNNAIFHAAFWKANGHRIALNIKELGFEKDLVNFLKSQGILENVFLFDFDIEFLGADPQKYINNIHALEPNLSCAVRVSDHSEPIKKALKITGNKIIWLDEFENFWATQEDIAILKKAGKIVYCISPDLHKFSLDQTKKRWQDFIAWGVDGICTNYALLLKQILVQ